MTEETNQPQVNMAKIAVGVNIGGAIFTVGSLAIFLIGVPVIRYLFPAAVGLGCGIALILKYVRNRTPFEPPSIR